MKTRRTCFVRWRMVAVYAVAMAWVEAAVVFYLRTLTQHLNPHRPDPVPEAGGLASLEMIREFATLFSG